MCEYCGCRRVPEIARLGAEHDVIDGVIAEVRKADPEEIAPLLDRLATLLRPHVEREEEGLFAEARSAGLGSYFVDDLEDDHRRFAAALEHREDLRGAPLERLLDDLDHHIAIEEYDLFPACSETLRDEHWHAIEAL